MNINNLDRININDIYNRKRKLSQDKEMIDLSWKDIYFFLNDNKYFMNNVASKFMDATPESYVYLLEILKAEDKYHMKRVSYDYIIKSFVDNCLIYYNDMDDVYNIITNSAIYGDIKTKLLAVVKYIKNLDNLCYNHDIINKRFNLYSLFDNGLYRYKIIMDLCKFIDTYNYSDIIKIKICFDEFFIINNFNEKVDLDVKESIFLIILYYVFKMEIHDKSEAIPLFTDINEYVNKYLSEYIDIYSLYMNNMSPFIGTSDNDSFPCMYIDYNSIDIKNIKDLISVIQYAYVQSVALDDTNVIRDILTKCYNGLLNKNLLEEVKKYMEDKIETVAHINDTIDSVVTPEEEYMGFTINCGPADTIKEVVFSDLDSRNISDLIKSAFTVTDYFAKSVGKCLSDNYGIKNGEIYNLYRSIGISEFKGYADRYGYLLFPVLEYTVIDVNKFKPEDVSKLENYLTSVAKNIDNNALYFSEYTVHMQFIPDSGLYVGLMSKFKIVLSIEDEENVDYDPTVYKKVYEFKNTANGIEEFFNINGKRLSHILSYLNSPDTNAASDISIREFAILYDIILYIFGSADCISYFVEKVISASSLVKADTIRDIINNGNPFDEGLKDAKTLSQAVDILEDVVSGIGTVKEANILNNLQLAWQGFKAKVKELSSKGKEMSRDMDMNFNNFMKSVKKSMVGDRREQIIRGEVCPSLSKIITTAIAMVGLGIACQTIVAPAIVAFGWLALSRNATKKEVAFIIDEIDIELKVLDREIQKAESSGSSKKYRNLLLIQKKLMRERQKIQYKYALSGKRIRMVTDFNKGVATTD